MRPAAIGLSLALAFGALLGALAEASPRRAATEPRQSGRAIDSTSERSTDADAARALRAGRYREARRLCRARLARAPEDLEAVIDAARAEQALGLYGEARARLEAAATTHPHALSVRDALMRLLGAIGDRAALAPYLSASYADWSAGRVDRSRAGDLLAIATAARLDGNWKDANDVLRDAVHADRQAVAANLDWGALLLDKHNAADAEAAFRAVVGIDPDNPDAHFGLAQIAVEDRYDAVAAREEIRRTLAVNPAHAGALALRGELALDAEDFEAARVDLAIIRRSNPRDPDAARVEAALAAVLDDRQTFERARDAALAVHPRDGAFFAFVADALSRQRRYEDARKVAAEGVDLDPNDARCLSVLGTTLLRLGEEAAGLEVLRRAWAQDPYDLRTYNLLDLYEKIIPTRYVTIASAHLTFRVEPTARAAIEAVVAPFLEERYRDEVRRYGFEPRGPIVFELYGDPRDFAIRTVGLPSIGVSGVCFGRVITSQAPTNHAFNWGMVLTHELAHVFAIELSRARVPRWFTEGLAENESARVRPEWSRHEDVALYGAWRRGELPRLGALSDAFVGARNADESTRAYALAAQAVAFLERKFGFAAIRAALVAYGGGLRGAAVLERMSGGRPIAELEAAFDADLALHFAAFTRQFLPAETLRDTASSTRRASASALAARGLAALERSDLEGAARALEGARAVSHPSLDERADTLFLAGAVALARRDADLAVAAFEGLLDLGPPEARGAPNSHYDGYDVRVRLGLAEIHRRRYAEAESDLRRAIDLDPTRVEPHALLAELYAEERRVPDRLGELEAALRLDPLNDAVAKEVVFGEARAGRPSRVVELAPIAIFIDPADPDLHAALGRALAATGQPSAAAAAFERALVFRPPDSASIHLSLAALYGTLGDRAKAAAHVAAARR